MIYIVMSSILAKQFLSLFINLKELHNSSAHLLNILYMEIIFLESNKLHLILESSALALQKQVNHNLIKYLMLTIT